MQLYLTGRNILCINDIDGNNQGNMWEFIGVFDDKDLCYLHDKEKKGMLEIDRGFSHADV